MKSIYARITVLVLALLALGWVAPRPSLGQSATSYTFTDLGVLQPASPYSAANGINEAGQIVGESRYPDGNLRAFRITPAIVAGQQVWLQDANNDGINDRMQVLSLPTRYAYSLGRSINASGEIAGEGDGTGRTLPQNSFFFNVNGTGQKTTSTQSSGWGINNVGSVAGSIFLRSGQFAARWDLVSGKWNETNLGALSGYATSIARAVNNDRQVAGWSWNSAGTVAQSCLWLPAPAYGLPAGVHSLGALPGHVRNWAESINNYGQVAGGSQNGGSTNHAYLWLPTAAYGLGSGMNDIHDPVWTSSYANEINNAPLGVLSIVGYGYVTGDDPRAVRWDSVSGLMADLNSLTSNLPAGYVLRDALDINDAGQIVGTATYGGATRAFVLTPQ